MLTIADPLAFIFVHSPKSYLYPSNHHSKSVQAVVGGSERWLIIESGGLSSRKIRFFKNTVSGYGASWPSGSKVLQPTSIPWTSFLELFVGLSNVTQSRCVRGYLRKATRILCQRSPTATSIAYLFIAGDSLPPSGLVNTLTPCSVNMQTIFLA